MLIIWMGLEMGNKKRHQKIFDPTDKEREELYNKTKVNREKYSIVDLEKTQEWLKLRKYAFELTSKELKDNGFGEFQKLKDVSNFDNVYIRISKLIEDIAYYIDMPEWGGVDRVKVMEVLVNAMVEKDSFDSSDLTKANYNREAENIQRNIEIIQFEYLERMMELTRKINQPLPKLTQYHVPLHPNDNYKIALDGLLMLKINKNYAESLLEVALNMKNVKTTKHRQRIIKNRTGQITKDLHQSIDDMCNHLPKEVQEAVKESINKTIDKLIPKP